MRAEHEGRERIVDFMGETVYQRASSFPFPNPLLGSGGPSLLRQVSLLA
jgi:hypothetical protein